MLGALVAPLTIGRGRASLLALSVLCAGCATEVQEYEGSARTPSEEAIIKVIKGSAVATSRIGIAAVDGKKFHRFGHPGVDTVHVLPGHHDIVLNWSGWGRRASPALCLFAVAGEHYIVRSSPDGYGMRAWFENERNQQVVGGISGGCDKPDVELKEIAQPPERVSLKGFSFVPLAESHWKIWEQKETRFVASKIDKSMVESWVIEAGLTVLSPVSGPEEFASTIKNKEEKDSEGRFTVLTHDVRVDVSRGAICAVSHWTAQDHAARSPMGTELVLETQTLSCMHPDDHLIGVSIVYSYRHLPGMEDPEFEQKANELLSTVVFSKL